MGKARSRFDVGWLIEIADERAAKEHAEEVVQEVLRQAEENFQLEKLVASHESDVKLVARC